MPARRVDFCGARLTASLQPMLSKTLSGLGVPPAPGAVRRCPSRKHGHTRQDAPDRMRPVLPPPQAVRASGEHRSRAEDGMFFAKRSRNDASLATPSCLPPTSFFSASFLLVLCARAGVDAGGDRFLPGAARDPIVAGLLRRPFGGGGPDFGGGWRGRRRRRCRGGRQ